MRASRLLSRESGLGVRQLSNGHRVGLSPLRSWCREFRVLRPVPPPWRRVQADDEQGASMGPYVLRDVVAGTQFSRPASFRVSFVLVFLSYITLNCILILCTNSFVYIYIYITYIYERPIAISLKKAQRELKCYVCGIQHGGVLQCQHPKCYKARVQPFFNIALLIVQCSLRSPAATFSRPC